MFLEEMGSASWCRNGPRSDGASNASTVPVLRGRSRAPFGPRIHQARSTPAGRGAQKTRAHLAGAAPLWSAYERPSFFGSAWSYRSRLHMGVAAASHLQCGVRVGVADERSTTPSGRHRQTTHKGLERRAVRHRAPFARNRRHRVLSPQDVSARRRAFRQLHESGVGFHLLDRIDGTRTAIATDTDAALCVLEEAGAAVRGPLETCPGCRITSQCGLTAIGDANRHRWPHGEQRAGLGRVRVQRDRLLGQRDLLAGRGGRCHGGRRNGRVNLVRRRRAGGRLQEGQEPALRVLLAGRRYSQGSSHRLRLGCLIDGLLIAIGFRTSSSPTGGKAQYRQPE